MCGSHLAITAVDQTDGDRQRQGDGDRETERA